MTRIFQISLFVLFVLAISALMGFIYYEQGKQTINEVSISINRTQKNGFVSEETVKAMITDYDSIAYTKANRLDTRKIETSIEKNPYIESVDVYVNIDKDLIINVKEKQAFLRVITRNGHGFYIDQNGQIFPLSPEFTPRVMIANGYFEINETEKYHNIYDSVYAGSRLPELFELCSLIKDNHFLNNQIGQVYLNSKGEFDLVPQLGKHLIKFGSVEDAENKLDKLDIFYKRALIGEGWDKFETINLKYKNQVVCKRK